MNQKELQTILKLHQKWLEDDPKGKRADLSGANLRRADLSDADLRRADLRRANLRRADLSDADLRRADLSDANLSDADLRRADLSDANWDFVSFPLWCGTFNMKADDRLVLQLFCHMTRLDLSGCSEDIKNLVANLPELAKNGFCKYRPDVEAVIEVKQ